MMTAEGLAEEFVKTPDIAAAKYARAGISLSVRGRFRSLKGKEVELVTGYRNVVVVLRAEEIEANLHSGMQLEVAGRFVEFNQNKIVIACKNVTPVAQS